MREKNDDHNKLKVKIKDKNGADARVHSHILYAHTSVVL